MARFMMIFAVLSIAAYLVSALSEDLESSPVRSQRGILSALFKRLHKGRGGIVRGHRQRPFFPGGYEEGFERYPFGSYYPGHHGRYGYDDIYDGRYHGIQPGGPYNGYYPGPHGSHRGFHRGSLFDSIF